MQRPRELRRSAEREIDVLTQHLGDVRARDLHALRELGLGDAKLLHAKKDLAQESRANMINCFQFKIRSRPVEYAAEYFTFGLFAELT